MENIMIAGNCDSFYPIYPKNPHKKYIKLAYSINFIENKGRVVDKIIDVEERITP